MTKAIELHKEALERKAITQSARLPPPPAPSDPSFGKQIKDGLARIGFVRAEDEILMETFARYLGITLRELRWRLQRRAAGQPAEWASDIRS